MKKLSFVFALLVAMTVSFTGCVRPYDKPEYVEVGPNETAFVIPMFTDENVKTEDQVHLNENVEFYQKNMVSSKLIQIPHKWIKTGRFARSGYYKGTVRVITVDLTPRSGNWLQNEPNAIKVETAASQGITIDQLASVDGLVYDDKSLQSNIDEQAKIQAQIVLEENKQTLIAKQKANKLAEANIEADVARAKASTLDIELKRAKAMQEIENTKIIAQAQAEAIKQGKYAPVPDTVVVQDLKALGSVRDLMQPNK